MEILRRLQDDLSKKKIEPEQFTDRIIFMPMFNDIEWSRRNIEEACYFEITDNKAVRAEIFARTLDVCWTWRRKEVVRNLRLQA